MTEQQTSSGSFPRGLGGLLIVMVFVVNAMILGYAVYTAMPRHDSHVARAAGDTDASQDEFAVDVSDRADEGGRDGRGLQQLISNIALPSQEEVDALYIQHCAACHGIDGRGKGPAAEQLYPKPRDFVDSPFRFASTTGDDDQIFAALERTIQQGVPRSAMPGFGGVLSESQIAGLARHVLSMHRASGSTVDAGELHVDIGRHPPFTPALRERGKELYVSLGCVTCHGPNGHGDGPGAIGLYDSSGQPVKPGDLASGLYKSGQTPESIARTILAGVPGTPMTPYEQMVIRTTSDGSKDATDLWALVAFIEGLSPQPVAGIASGAEMSIEQAPDDAMVADPAHIGWVGVDETAISLRPLWQRDETTTTVNVRAVWSADNEVAICLDWKDDTPDFSRDSGTFPDGAAVMFALGEQVPALPMGVQIEQHQPEDPVNLWHWRADRQYEAAAQQRMEITQVMPNANQRWYMFRDTEGSTLPATASGVHDALAYPQLADGPGYYTAGAAGNVYASSELVEHAALEANALGFGTLTLQPPAGQSTYSSAAWTDGMWRVVMRRSLTTADADDIQFNQPRRIPVAFAIWNGSKGDRAGAKLVSGWHWLIVEDPPPSKSTAAAHSSDREPLR